MLSGYYKTEVIVLSYRQKKKKTPTKKEKTPKGTMLQLINAQSHRLAVHK